MNVRNILIILLSFLFSLNVSAQIQTMSESVPYSTRPGNTMWLTNLTSEQVRDFYLDKIPFKPEKIVPLNEKTAKGYKLYYKHQGSLGWQKYSISVTTLDIKNCICYYEDTNPDLLMLPFTGLKSMIGSFNHTPADFKKIYKQYQHLACRLYRESIDSKGNVSNEMATLLQKYMTAATVSEENLVASGDMSTPVPQEKIKKDNWNYWLGFLQELDNMGYITLIEYSTANVK